MNRVTELEGLIIKHKALYYQGRPEISDSDFDQLEEELRRLDPKNIVLQIVGTTSSSSEKIEHQKKMLSLNKTYSEKDLSDWKNGHTILGMFKVDGVSCSLVYSKGELKIAKTRGDGRFGENITDKVVWMSNIPKHINFNKDLEIRGELFCSEENFFYLSEEMAQIGLERPTSQRNIVAGLIGRKENIELCRFISFWAFDM